MKRASFVALALFAARPATAAETILPPAVPERAPDAPPKRHERDPDALGWYVPDFFRLQVGGWVGLAVVGTGYAAFDDILNLSVHYGFTPADYAGTNVHTFSVEIAIRPFDLHIADLRFVPFYFGPGLLYALGDDFFTRVPDRYAQIDSRYYPPTALHWTARVGTELDWVPQTGFFERHGIYYEATLLGSYFELYVKNSETLDFLDMFGGAVGYRAAF